MTLDPHQQHVSLDALADYLETVFGHGYAITIVCRNKARGEASVVVRRDDVREVVKVLEGRKTTEPK